MAVQEIDVRATLDAPPATVWRLLADSSTWPDWTPVERFELERAAGPDGTGEIRLFHTGRRTMREEIVEFVPERRLTYTLLAGLALRGYRAEIDLAPAALGTDLRWHTTFRSTMPGMGSVYRKALDTITRQFVAGLGEAVAVSPAATDGTA